MNQYTEYKTGQRCCLSETFLPSENGFLVTWEIRSLNSFSSEFVSFSLFSLFSLLVSVWIRTKVMSTWVHGELDMEVNCHHAELNLWLRPITGRGIVESFFLSSWTRHVVNSLTHVWCMFDSLSLHRKGLGPGIRSPTSWKDASDAAGNGSPPMETTRSCNDRNLKVGGWLGWLRIKSPNFLPITSLSHRIYSPRHGDRGLQLVLNIGIFESLSTERMGSKASRSDLQNLSRFGMDDTKSRNDETNHPFLSTYHPFIHFHPPACPPWAKSKFNPRLPCHSANWHALAFPQHEMSQWSSMTFIPPAGK